ncbi:MAG: RHS repeat-associated core domain-containing protein [Janthinobacterium lividum]
MAFSLGWLQISPAYGMDVSLRREATRQAAWHLAHMPHVQLAPGLTQTPDAALRKKIDAKEAAARVPKAVADVRSLTAAEMGQALGRGPLRNPYLAGAPMPWHRAFHDVDVNTGNLFKSFTDIQVAPARGAGLVLQRTYNSDETRVGPFGLGWTHAYDIRIQEAADIQAQAGNSAAVPPAVPGSTTAATAVNEVPRTDFFGAKQTYHRDADGLYSPPPYLYDEMSSAYGKFLVNGPAQVMSDTDKGMDGTIKHYTNVVIKADGTSGNERACDYIQDRYGNKTTLTYGQSYVQPDGSTRSILTLVTDPTGRSLTFHWTNFGTTAQPTYRITEIDAPIDPAMGTYAYRVTYDYYTDPNDPNVANDLFNLKAVHLDPDGLNRTTTYTYTNCAPVTLSNYRGNISEADGPTEYGLLGNLTDPLGHTVSYTYGYIIDPGNSDVYAAEMNVLYVSQIIEPGSGGKNTWTISFCIGLFSGWFLSNSGTFAQGGHPPPPSDGPDMSVDLGNDLFHRTNHIGSTYSPGEWEAGYAIYYDNSNNVIMHDELIYQEQGGANQSEQWLDKGDAYTYGQHGNVLTHQFVLEGPHSVLSSRTFFPGQDTTAYYNASQYFQKTGVTDMDGHTTAMGVGTNTAGNTGDPDPNTGDRGQTLWVQDAGYNDSISPSYHKQFTYTYNQYGQKLSETNLNSVVTQYTYGTNGADLGNLTQVVQDPGTGHLNRTTSMHYDIMGRVLQSTDPSGQTSTFTYNTLGQPKSVSTPMTSAAAAEVITYAYGGDGRTHSVTDNRGTTTIIYEDEHYGDYQNYASNVYSVSDPVTGTISYTYFRIGARKTMTLPGGSWTYQYASSGDMPKDDLNDQVVLSKVVDDQGRSVEFSQYDATYPLKTGGGVTSFPYDHHLRQAKSDEVYDANGNLVSYLLTCYRSDNDTATNEGNGQLTMYKNTHDWTSDMQTFWVDAKGHHARLVADHSYGYDNAGLRTSHAITTAVSNADGTPQYTGGSPTYDSNGIVTNQVTSSRTETYTYDDLNRLSTVNYGDGETQSYGFDPMGNRLQKTDSSTGTTNSVFDAANRLTSTTGTGASTYTNDADGNTLTGGGRTNTWDSQNRLVSCAYNGSTTTNTYGADGLRRSSTVNGVTTYYVYDGQTLIREMQKNPTTGALFNTATYLTGPRGPEYRRDDTLQEKDSQGNTVSKTRWYVYDGLGSVVGELDPSGNMTSSPKYDVYGGVRSNSGTASSKMGFVGGLGHLSEANTGLIYMKARYYDPTLGRFASEDPDAKHKNWFVYCSNNPINRTDASGRSDDPVSDLYNQLESWGADHPFTSALITLFTTKFVSLLPAMAQMAKETVGMGLMLIADAMISGGRSLMEQGGVSLTIYGISSMAVDGGETLALGSAMRGAAQGLGGASELAAGLALKSVAEFMYYS